LRQEGIAFLPLTLGSVPAETLALLERRRGEVPLRIEADDAELARLGEEWGGRLLAWREALRGELERRRVVSQFGETASTFVLVGWLPSRDLPRIEASLREAVGERALVRDLPVTQETRKLAPVALSNRALARPFESLVKLQSLPRYGTLDPTTLMAFFLPLFYGMMLGDVGYGLLLLVLSLLLLRRLKAGTASDILKVMAVGAGWAIGFGFLYGEVFGTLGEHLGLRPLWLDRTEGDNVQTLLLLSLAVGAVHVTLGLVIGLYEALREHSRVQVLDAAACFWAFLASYCSAGQRPGTCPRSWPPPRPAGCLPAQSCSAPRSASLACSSGRSSSLG